MKGRGVKKVELDEMSGEQTDRQFSWCGSDKS